MFEAPLILDYYCNPPRQRSSQCTPMQIGRDARRCTSLPRAVPCSLAPISSHGPPCARTRYLGPVTNAVAEVTWLCQLLLELHAPPHASLVYCDNISTVYMSSNPVQHQRTKHIEIDLHFVRERVATGVMSASCMYLHLHSTLTFSPKAFHLRCSRSSGPV